MPEMMASHSSQRIAALLDFQRDVDLMSPSHVGSKSSPPADHHHRTHRGGDTSWRQIKSWSEYSLSSFLSRASTKMVQLPIISPPRDRPFGVGDVEHLGGAVVTRSEQGQCFSPQRFIRNVLKRALRESSRDDDQLPALTTLNAKRARTTPFVNCVGYRSNHAMEPMVLCAT